MSRFRYPLGALLTRDQWRLDTALLSLASLQRDIVAQQAVLDHTRATLAAAADVMHSAGQVIDLAKRGRMLDYLGSLHRAKDTQLARLKALEAALERARADCLASQRQVDIKQTHRASMEKAFFNQQAAHDMHEADRDWLSRLGAVQNRSGAVKEPAR